MGFERNRDREMMSEALGVHHAGYVLKTNAATVGRYRGCSIGSLSGSSSSCLRLRFFFPQDTQLPFGNYNFREATVQTDHKLWKHPHEGLVQTLTSWEMNGDFSVEIALVF